jgi:hypothetical protein
VTPNELVVVKGEALTDQGTTVLIKAGDRVEMGDVTVRFIA